MTTKETGAEIQAMTDAVGTEGAAEDILTPELVRRFVATVGGEDVDLSPGAVAPLAIHWCLAPTAVDGHALAADGHPGKGLYPPPRSLPRRMWASGELRFLDDLFIGDMVRRTSRVSSVVPKQGSTGLLCFVTLDHALKTQRGTAIAERQTIVYRKPAASTAETVQPADSDLRYAVTDEVQLFRYSALTFNAHRIHYDQPHATAVEGYPGLVVQGPLQATLLLAHAKARTHLETFSFRGLKPLFCGESFAIGATDHGYDIIRSNGDVTMTSLVNAAS